MENTKESIPTRKMLLKFVPFLQSYKKWLYLLASCGVATAILEITSSYLLKNLTDSVINEQYDKFQELIILSVGLMVFGAGVLYLKGQSSARYETYNIRDFRNRVTSHIQHLPLSFVESLHSGDLISRLNNDIDKIAEFLRKVFDLFYQPVVFILGFSYMLFLSWKLLLVTCILIPISAVLYNKVIKPMQIHSQKQMEHLARANAVTQDAIQGIYIIKAFNLQSILTKKYQSIAKDIEDEGIAIEKRAAVEFALFLALRFVPQLTLPLYGGFLAFSGEITVGDLIACVSLIWLVILPVEALLGWVRLFREITPAIDRIFHILDQQTELNSGSPFKATSLSAPVIFNKVSFQYNGDTKVLDNLSFQIEDGKTVALVGSSGCGKSTILKLICGFYKPKNGNVYIYGNDLFETNMSDIRSQLALVSQETYLFPTSIAENISYGRLNATENEIVAAAKVADAHEFIMEQPEGYETQTGEWGMKLSGGERQRIALARAILKNAPILLLDEPTSALDTQSEAQVQNAINHLMQNRTVIIIAHRLSTIKAVDQILVLDQGIIKETGTHKQLMRSNGLYKRLYLKQTQDEGTWNEEIMEVGNV